jgi:hypothetical protein
MPVFDLVGFAKSFAKFLLYVGLFIYIATVAGTIISILNSFAGMINTGIDSIDDLFDTVGGGNSSLSCMYYMISALGIDVVLTSFFSSAIGLLMAWGGAILGLVTIKSTIYLKNMAIKAIR